MFAVCDSNCWRCWMSAGYYLWRWNYQLMERCREYICEIEIDFTKSQRRGSQATLSDMHTRVGIIVLVDRDQRSMGGLHWSRGWMLPWKSKASRGWTQTVANRVNNIDVGISPYFSRPPLLRTLKQSERRALLKSERIVTMTKAPRAQHPATRFNLNLSSRDASALQTPPNDEDSQSSTSTQTLTPDSQTSDILRMADALSVLTQGCLLQVTEGTPVENPVVQCLQIKPMNNQVRTVHILIVTPCTR